MENLVTFLISNYKLHDEMSQMTKMDTVSVTKFWRFTYFMHLILWIISINSKVTTKGSCVYEWYVQFQNKNYYL